MSPESYLLDDEEDEFGIGSGPSPDDFGPVMRSQQRRAPAVRPTPRMDAWAAHQGSRPVIQEPGVGRRLLAAALGAAAGVADSGPHGRVMNPAVVQSGIAGIKYGPQMQQQRQWESEDESLKTQARLEQERINTDMRAEVNAAQIGAAEARSIADRQRGEWWARRGTGTREKQLSGSKTYQGKDGQWYLLKEYKDGTTESVPYPNGGVPSSETSEAKKTVRFHEPVDLPDGTPGRFIQYSDGTTETVRIEGKRPVKPLKPSSTGAARQDKLQLKAADLHAKRNKLYSILQQPDNSMVWRGNQQVILDDGLRAAIYADLVDATTKLNAIEGQLGVTGRTPMPDKPPPKPKKVEPIKPPENTGKSWWDPTGWFGPPEAKDVVEPGEPSQTAPVAAPAPAAPTVPTREGFERHKREQEALRNKRK